MLQIEPIAKINSLHETPLHGTYPSLQALRKLACILYGVQFIYFNSIDSHKKNQSYMSFHARSCGDSMDYAHAC